MHVSIMTNNVEMIEMSASDVGIMNHGYTLWNAILDERYHRKTDYDVFRAFCDNIVYKKPRSENVATSNDYYLFVPHELIDSMFVHETRYECGLKGNEI